jgi:hypothetical protein
MYLRNTRDTFCRPHTHLGKATASSSTPHTIASGSKWSNPPSGHRKVPRSLVAVSSTAQTAPNLTHELSAKILGANSKGPHGPHTFTRKSNDQTREQTIVSLEQIRWRSCAISVRTLLQTNVTSLSAAVKVTESQTHHHHDSTNFEHPAVGKIGTQCSEHADSS